MCGPITGPGCRPCILGFHITSGCWRPTWLGCGYRSPNKITDRRRHTLHSGLVTPSISLVPRPTCFQQKSTGTLGHFCTTYYLSIGISVWRRMNNRWLLYHRNELLLSTSAPLYTTLPDWHRPTACCWQEQLQKQWDLSILVLPSNTASGRTRRWNNLCLLLSFKRGTIGISLFVLLNTSMSSALLSWCISTPWRWKCWWVILRAS